ncbi:MAG: hypothetical protein ACFB9N_13660 [Geitlerinemataceae cyanobacterium]
MSLVLAACSGDVADEPAVDAVPPEAAEAAATTEAEAPDSAADRDALWRTYERDKAERLTAAARILAGLPPETDAIAIDSAAKDAYTERINEAWNQLKGSQLEALEAWRSEYLTNVPADAPVLYPFSGPDFLYVSSFFPDAPVYVMVGLEPIGALPDFENATEAELAEIFDWADKSLFALLNFSFFRTNAMEKDLQDRGTVPVMMLFAARNGYDILDLTYVGIDDEGKVQRLEEDNPDELVPGIRIDVAKSGSDRAQQLYYFSVDLSDAGFDSRPGLSKFFGQLDRPVTYLKAASYLMHNEYFSIVRDALLERSQYILQDDSGIPLRFFDAENWARSFFGQYNGPIELFATRLQADLKAAFASGDSVLPLPFGIGYKYQGDSNLMLAEREGEPPLRGELDSPDELMPDPNLPEPSELDDTELDEATSGKAAPRRRDRDDADKENAEEALDVDEAVSERRREGRDRGDSGDLDAASEADPTRIPKPDILREPEALDDVVGEEASESGPDEDGVFRIPEPSR